mgnify:CR=1 FL=1
MKTYEERYEYVISRIKEEKAKKTTNKTHVIKYVSIAAALVLVVTAAGLAITHVGSVNTPENDGVIVRHLPMDTATDTSGEIARAHAWEELIDPARYKEITINGRRYVTKLIAVHAEHEGEFIGTAQITGQDEVTLEMHEQTVSIYSITGMAEEAAVAIRNNICRCTGYVKIIDGILLAAKIFRDGKLPEPGENDYQVGSRVHRIDVAEKVQGYGKYPDDIYVDGMCYGSTVRSEYPRARVLSIDTSEAEALSGVVCVLTAKDIPGKNYVGHIKKDQPTLIPVGEITHYLGDSVALVCTKDMKTRP